MKAPVSDCNHFWDAQLDFPFVFKLLQATTQSLLHALMKMNTALMVILTKKLSVKLSCVYISDIKALVKQLFFLSF